MGSNAVDLLMAEEGGGVVIDSEVVVYAWQAGDG